MGFFDKVKEAASGAAAMARDAVADHDFSATIENAKNVAKSTAGRAVEVSRNAASMATDAIQDLDVKEKVAGAGRAVSSTAAKAAEISSNAIAMASDAITDNTKIPEALNRATNAVKSATESATQAAWGAYGLAVDASGKAYQSAADGVRNFDYEQLRQMNFYAEKFTHYKDLSVTKVSETFRSTFEVDKSTMEMVDDVRGRLPVPAKTVDDIFEQCKREAIRRAVSAFGLGAVMLDADKRSEEKYSNLSESYTSFESRSKYEMAAEKNFVDMGTERTEAKKAWTNLENGYNKSEPLDPRSADREHVIAKKELYVDPLLRIATTDDEFYALINAKENLVFAERSLNRSLQDEQIHSFLDRRGRPDAANPDLVHIDIEQDDGLIKTVTVSRKNIDEEYERADAKRTEHRLAAAKEVGLTVATAGATMAAQQVVGLIVVETIDIFVDEIKNLASNGSVISANGWLQNTTDAKDRIQQRLAQRFEERQIWERARALGIEAGVAGALSVIPQILISMIVKTPAFVLAIIRESTLSVVRCARILASDDGNKLDSMKVILAGTASAIVGVYVGRVIGSAIAGVPLLNKFNSQVTGVLTGLVVTAVPLVAIYTFERNKQSLSFSIAKVRALLPI